MVSTAAATITTAATPAAHESEPSQSLSDTSCSRNQSGSMQVAGEEGELASSQGAHEDVVKNCKKRQRADDEAATGQEELPNPSDAVAAAVVPPQSPPKQQEQQRPSPQQQQRSPPEQQPQQQPQQQPPRQQQQQPQPWWLPQPSLASPHPPVIRPQSPFLGRMLDGQLLDFASCSRPEHQQHSRQIIRPTSAFPHDKSFFSLGLAESLQFRGSSEAGESSSSSRFTNSSSLSEGGRKSFVEWRPLVPPESAGSGFRPPAAQLPSWSIGQAAAAVAAAAAAAAAHHHHHQQQQQQQSTVNYFLPPPLSTSTTYNSSNRMMLGSSLTYSAGMPHTGGWGTPHQFAAMQSLAAGILPGQERLPATNLLFLGPSATAAPDTAASAVVSVVLDDRLTSGSINLHEHQSYASLARAVRHMFQESLSEPLPQEECNLSNAVPGHIIAYEDAEGDLLLAGDLSWSDFVRAAKRIKILPAKGRSVLPVP